MNRRQANRLKKLIRSTINLQKIERLIDRYTAPSCKRCGRELVDGERRKCNDCDLRGK